MSAMTGAGSRRLRPFERLLAALCEPSRRERTALLVLLGYLAVWTLYAVVAKSSQDVHYDMAEQCGTLAGAGVRL